MDTTADDLLAIGRGYADAFPDGDEPLHILARMTEELGEVAAEVAHLERHGAKVHKRGEPDVAHLAAEIEDLLHNVFALVRHYRAEDAVDASVARTLTRLREAGHLSSDR